MSFGGFNSSAGFGSSAPGFGFGAGGMSPGFGASSGTPAFGGTSLFGNTQGTGFGAASSGGSIFGGGSAFGGGGGVFGGAGASSPFGIATNTTGMFGVSSSGAAGASSPFAGSSFGNPSSAPFGNSGFGGGFGNTSTAVTGTAQTAFAPHQESEGAGRSGLTSFQSITSMKQFEGHSNEELRQMDYQAGNKGGSAGGMGGAFGGGGSVFGAQSGGFNFASSSGGFRGGMAASSPFGASSSGSLFGGGTFGGSSGNVFGQSSAAGFGSNTGAFGGGKSLFGQGTANTFGASSTGFGGFGAASSAPTNFFGGAPASGGGFGASSGSMFGSFGPSSSIFGQAASTPAFGVQSSGAAFGGNAFGTAFGAPSSAAFGFQHSTAGQSLFGATSGSIFGGGTTTNAFGASSGATSLFGPSSSTLFGGATTGTGLFGASSASMGFGGLAGPGQSSSFFGAQHSAPAFGAVGPNTAAQPQPSFGFQSIMAGTQSANPQNFSDIYGRIAPELPAHNDTSAAQFQVGLRSAVPPLNRRRVDRGLGLMVPAWSREWQAERRRQSWKPKQSQLRVTRWDNVKDGGGNLFLDSRHEGDEDGNTYDDDESVNWPKCEPVEGLFSSPKTVDKLSEIDPIAKMNDMGDDDGAQDLSEERLLTGREIKQRLPKISQTDYYLKPDIRGLTNMLRGDPNALKEVHSLIIGRTGYGYIKYSVPIDIEGVDICSHLAIKRGGVVLFAPNEADAHQLNGACEVTLEGVFLPGKDKKPKKDENSQEKLKAQLQKYCRAEGITFLSYDDGIWRFKANLLSQG